MSISEPSPQDAPPPELNGLETEARPARDLASVLPFLIIVLLCPPIVLIFTAPTMIGGVPLIALYIFGIWAVAILCTGLIARRLALPEDHSDDSGSGSGMR